MVVPNRPRRYTPLEFFFETFEPSESCFEEAIEPLLADLLAARDEYEEKLAETDELVSILALIQPGWISCTTTLGSSNPTTPSLRSSHTTECCTHISSPPSQKTEARATEVTPLPSISLICHHVVFRHVVQAPETSSIIRLDTQPESSVNSDTLNALYSIETTPFSSSFLSRLHGTQHLLPSGLIAIDWETRTPWMDLMADIRDHYSFAQSVSSLVSHSL
jgi:hypothetical protein